MSKGYFYEAMETLFDGGALGGVIVEAVRA